MEARIPNLNTLSTLIDRVTIENVKLAHFENALEHDPLSSEQRAAFERKVATQRVIIEALKKELEAILKEVLLAKDYHYLREERTFA